MLYHLCRRQMVKRSLWNRNVITFNCCPIWWLPYFTSHLKDHLLVCLWWKAGWENSTILAKKLFYIFIGSWCLVFCTWSDMSYLACAGTASPHQVQAGELEENPKPHHFDHKCVSLKEYKSPFLKVYKTQAGQKPSLEVNITARVYMCLCWSTRCGMSGLDGSRLGFGPLDLFGPLDITTLQIHIGLLNSLKLHIRKITFYKYKPAFKMQVRLNFLSACLVSLSLHSASRQFSLFISCSVLPGLWTHFREWRRASC